MSNPRDLSGDVNRVVRSWLREDRHEDADRVLGAVLDELDTTPQRRSTPWTAWRELFMDNNVVRVGLVAAAAVIIAVIAINLLPGSPAPGGEPSSTPEPTVTSAPSASPLAALNDQDPLDPGRYLVNSGPGITVTVAAPSGWSAGGDWVLRGPRGNETPDGMAIRFYSGDLNIYVDPISPSAGQLDPPIGPTVDDLAQAIVANPAWMATAPTDIEIDGHPGQLVQLTIPVDAPLTGAEEFYLFVDASGGQVWGMVPGQTFDLYILDVDGVRLVIDAYHYLDTSAEDLAAQRSVVETVQASANP
jgi:hypothetical protein